MLWVGFKYPIARLTFGLENGRADRLVNYKDDDGGVYKLEQNGAK